MNVYFTHAPFFSLLFILQQVTSAFLPSCCSQICGACPQTCFCPNSLPCSSPNILPICGPEQFCPPTIDPVSLALAFQAQKESIREEKLNFGPNRMPLDGRPIKSPLNILEDGLFSLNKQIVELKSSRPRKTLAEEAADSFLDDDYFGFDADLSSGPRLTYADLGYTPEPVKCPQFVPGSPPTCPCLQGQVIYSGPVPSQPASPCVTQPSQCVPNVYQPGALYLTQIGCRNAACSPDCPCQQQCCCGQQQCSCDQQQCC